MTKYLLNNTRNTSGNSATALKGNSMLFTNSFDGLPMFFKSIALALAMLVVGIGSSWGQNTCLAPQVIASLPYTLASSTTCGTVNNYTTTIGGSASYVSGEDRIFRFVPATSGTVTISVTQPSGAYLGMFLYTGCPFTAYIGGVQNNLLTKSFTATVTAGTTYYLMLDHWATPNCSAFTNLTISAPAAAFNPCTTIPTLTCGAAATSYSMAGSAGVWNTYGGAYSVPGQEKLFQFTPTVTGSYAVTMSVSTGYNDFFCKAASVGCNPTSWTYVNDILGTETWNVTLTAGVSYYFMLDDEDIVANTGTISVACIPPPICAASPTAPTTGATGVATAPTLSWAAVAGATGYDVYFGTANPATTLVSTNQAGLTYSPIGLSGGTTYYWRIVPRNGAGSATGCATWSFTTIPPLATCPTLTAPANAATGVSLAPTLSWTAGANTSSYNVYLSTNQIDVNNQAAGALVSTAQTGTFYNSATLTPSTTYYWRIVPKNSAGAVTTGCTTRSFTTATPSPTVSQSGTLSAFSACPNVASTEQSFSVSGLYLTGNLVVTAPTGFSVSTTSGSGWASSVSLTPAGGTVSSTLIYVRMNALASNPTASNVVCSSTSASSVNVAVSGSLIAAPTVNAGSDFNLCSGQNIVMNASTNAVGSTLSGNTSATYSAGNGSSLYSLSTTTSTLSSCPISLAVNIPVGATITGVNVSYNMIAASGAYMSEQSSYLRCTNAGGTAEASVSVGAGAFGGTMTYNRNNLTIANGVSGGGTINFQLHAFRSWGGTGCEAVYNYVNNNTFTVTVNYTYVGDPTYAWSPATGLSATNVLNPTCSTTSTQTYTLTVTGGNGCSASDQVVATVAGGAVPTTPTASVSGASTVNVGGTAILTSTAGANTVWYTTATGGTSVGTGSPFTTPVQCASGSVTYYAEENNGTCASNARGAVSFTVRPMLVSNPANALICQAGGSVTLSAQLSGATGITWSPNTNLSTTSGASTVASPTTTTVYTMNATVAGCGSVSGTQTVGVIDAVAFTPTSTPASVCAGNTAALASNLASSGFTVTPMTCALSSVPGSGVTTLCAGGTSVVTPTSTGGVYPLDDSGWGNIPIGFTYNFFGTNYSSLNVGTNGVVQFGAYNATALADFTYTTLPNASEPLNIIALAANDNNLSVTGASSSIQYWTEGIAPTRVFVLYYNQAVQYATGPGFTTGQIKLFETTGNVETHITTSTSTNNKVVGLQNFDASIGAMPYSSINAITNQAWKFIPGANYSFQWATAGSNIGSATATTYTTPTLSTPGTVTYNVAATNPNTNCTTTQSVNITVNALPSAPVSAGNVTACNTAGSQNLVVSTASGVTADWYAASTGGSVLASGNNVLSYSTATAATYYAEAQNTTTGCVSATRTAVTLNSNTAPSAPTASAATYCQGVTATALTASTPSGSNTQSWYTVPSGGTPLSGAPIPFTASTGTTTYYVSETSGSNGCESTRTSVSVTVNATPSAPVASNPAAYCQNDAASALSATAGAGNTLYWYTVPTGGTGSTTAITPSTASSGSTDYYVSQMSASNCESSRTLISVTVNPSITPSVASGASSTSACGGNAITFTATPTNGGTPTYQWYLNGNPVGSNSATYTTNQASDNAVNYSGTWNNGSNQGSGMAAWSFNVGANSGQFIGNPANDGNGTAGIGSNAHGIYANGGAYINTTRGFSTPMQIGDEMRFYWVFNWDANGGNKGFDLRSGGSTIFNVNNGGSAAITVTGGATADGAYGTTPMYVQVTRTSASQYTFSMTRRSGGSTYTTTFNSASAIDGVSFYIGGQNDGSGQRNLYFNGLEMRAPQANDQIYVAMTPSSQACLTSASAVNSSTIALTSSAATPTTAIQSSASSAFCPGTSVTFSVNASANMGASPTYQWNLNGTPIGGATSATLVSTSLANNDQVTLTMTSSLNSGCLTQSSATSAAITSAVNNGTTISSQPIAVSSCLGGTQSFSVSGAGTGTLTYQWQKNSTNITGNFTATASTLTLAGISSGDVANYTVVVTGTCGTVTSSAAALSLNAATAISVQPSAVTACTATNAIFSVTATGYGTVTYQWRKDGTPISGATGSSYTATGVTSSNVGNYSVIVTGACGNVTSSNAALAVQPATVISSQPVGSTICASNTANFSVTASGQGTLAYQWQLNGASISGATSSALSVSNAQVSNAGSITVVVTGACGSSTSNAATFTVNPTTSITTQPVGSTAGCNIQNYTFSVVAAGTSLSYQWNFASANVGTNSASYTISNATTANDGNYYVTVSGGCGNPVNSSIVALSVNPSPTANAGADVTGASTCGKNTVPVSASALTTGQSGQWSVLSATNNGGNLGLFSLAGTAANDQFTGAYGGTYVLQWALTSGGCTGTDQMTVTFNQPTDATISALVGSGDLLWCGLTGTDWSTSTNWYQKQAAGHYVRMSGAAQPGIGNEVFTVSTANGGMCVGNSTPSLSVNSNAEGVYVGAGVVLDLSNDSITIAQNLINQGTIAASTGTVNFTGINNSTVSGSGTAQLFNMRVNKSAGATLTLQQPVLVTNVLTMNQGNVFTTSANVLTLGTSSTAPGSLSYNSGTIVGPFKRYFANAASAGTAGLFPVGTAVYNRYADFSFGSGPGVDQFLTVEYKTGAPLQGGVPLYNGLPLTALGSLIQNYSADGYWSVIPTDNNYTAPITSVNYGVTLFANNLTGMQSPQVCRIIKSAGSNTTGQHHVGWQACGTHTPINGAANPQAFLITSTATQGFSWFNIGTPNSQALPVELLSFNGDCNEGQVNLGWQTATEHNSDYFEVEKSRDGMNWQVLTTVNAAGNSTQLLNYDAIDAHAMEGNNYYRLTQVDIDGTTKTYDVINVSCSGAAKGYFSAYPNPSTGSFQVILNDKNLVGTGSLSVKDTKGAELLNRTIEVKPGINMFSVTDLNLAPGVYYIQIVNGERATEVLKEVIR